MCITHLAGAPLWDSCAYNKGIKMNIYEAIKYLSLLLYIFFSKYKINPNAMSSILLGVGTGVVANVMFVITTEKDFHFINLSISFFLGIILLTIGSLEKKDK